LGPAKTIFQEPSAFLIHLFYFLFFLISFGIDSLGNAGTALGGKRFNCRYGYGGQITIVSGQDSAASQHGHGATQVPREIGNINIGMFGDFAGNAVFVHIEPVGDRALVALHDL
jgi:hypothetical protein